MKGSSEITYDPKKILFLISGSNREDLKSITTTIWKEKRLYNPITMNLIAKAISKRLLELGPP